MLEFFVNRERVAVVAPPGAVLLDVLRGELGLKGTKEGCREGDCGACSVLIGERTKRGVVYSSAASCLLPVGSLHGQHIVTIEGLTETGLSPIQQAIVDEGATQCGFCTPGIVVALAGFLLTSESFSVADAEAAVEGNICRCTGYASIRRATQRLVTQLADVDADQSTRLEQLVGGGLLPSYFLDIPKSLDAIDPEHAPSPDAGPAVRVSGGTDLFVQQADQLVDGELRFLGNDESLKGIERIDDTVVIGAATPVESLLHDPLVQDLFPKWPDLLRLVSSTLIRNRATLAGNIVNASPIGDLSILLLALDAQLTIRSGGCLRHAALDVFYHGYKQFDLKSEEIIENVIIPIPATGSLTNFEKVSRREHLDIASVNTALSVTVEAGIITRARVAAGGVAPVPLFMKQSSDWLSGQPVSPATVTDLLSVADAEIAPISDVRGSETYKRRLLRRLLVAHFVELFPELEIGELPV